MSINTDKLIPGECYWVRFHESHDWSIAKFTGYCLYFTGGDIGANHLTFMFFCDTEGNPIPIKPPGSKEKFAKMVLNTADSVSETAEAATEYLRSEGIDVEEVLQNGLKFIESLKEKIRLEKAGASYFKTDTTQ